MYTMPLNEERKVAAKASTVTTLSCERAYQNGVRYISKVKAISANS